MPLFYLLCGVGEAHCHCQWQRLPEPNRGGGGRLDRQLVEGRLRRMAIIMMRRVSWGGPERSRRSELEFQQPLVLVDTLHGSDHIAII
jgi:hypothetical protein